MHAPFTTHSSPDTIALTSATRPSLSIYDGQTRFGYLVRGGAAFESFDNNDVSYGVHPDMRTAAFSLPARSVS
jgi:hypothetical protein